MCHQFNEFQNYYSSYNKIDIKDAKLTDGDRLKQKHIRKCFKKNISGILAYVLQSNATQNKTFKTLYTLASTA